MRSTQFNASFNLDILDILAFWAFWAFWDILKKIRLRPTQRRQALISARLVLFLFPLAAMLGCASAKKDSRPSSEVIHASASPAASPEGDVFAPPAGDFMPAADAEPVPSVRSLVLVLGPGMARGFAYSGVLTALRDLKIPVAAILGTEIGALIGALYVTSPNLNQFEWRLLRFKEEVFKTEGGFLARFKSKAFSRSAAEDEGKKLEQRLTEIFEKKTLQSSPIPFRVAVQAKDLRIPLVLDKGYWADVIRGALAVPGVLTPANLTVELPQSLSGVGEKIDVISAGTTQPFLVAEAKRLNLGPVVVINVLSDGEMSAVIADELKQADLVIRPNVGNIGYGDFNKRTDAAFQGKLAITNVLDEIERVIANDRSMNP